MLVKHWTHCRVCQSSPLASVIKFGSQHIVGFPEHVALGESAPLDLVLCTKCGLLQLEDSVDASFLFRHFWYQSGINEQMKAALSEVVNKAVQIAAPVQGDAVLDIGSNDGTLLSFYPAGVLHRVGVEPAENIEQIDKSSDVLVHEFFSKAVGVLSNCQFKIITAIAMFYDLDDPAEFLQGVRQVLAPNGVLIIQMNALSVMLKNLAFDNISHEHVCYYSLTTLKFLAEICGFDVIDVSENSVNGGSLRVYLMQRGAMPDGITDVEFMQGRARVHLMLKEEATAELLSPVTYKRFQSKITAIQTEVNRFVHTVVAKDKKVCLYGASTRGTMLMQTLNIANYVLGAAERDAKKYYRTMAGTAVRIFPEALLRTVADYFVVLPWHFLPSILEREKEWGKRGGRFVVPLPEPRMYMCSEGPEGEWIWNSLPLGDELYNQVGL
jgi:SAM-dependent methyltransferase